MALLIATSNVGAGQQFTIDTDETVIGRSAGLPIKLSGPNISRRHARILRDGNKYLVEDLGSSNGTYLNDRRITGLTQMSANDTLRIGPYMFRFELPGEIASDLTIQRQTLAMPGNTDLYDRNPAFKLQAVLQLAHDLGNTLDLDALVSRFFDQVVKLFPKTDRALVLFLENGEPVVRLVRERHSGPRPEQMFSRSVLRQVVEKGIAVLAEDTQKLDDNRTLTAMGVCSLLCVPLRAQGTPVFGVVQLERFRPDDPFTSDDLHLLTAVTLQASMALEKSRMHQRLLEQERISRELALAREIQLAFLPHSIPEFPEASLDLLAELNAAEEVSGDFYDYVKLDSTKVMLVVADVSGKGMPAALFMSMVRALLRQVCKATSSPAEILRLLNIAVAPDNPKFMFVTVVVAVFDVLTGECVIARGGHPAPLLRTSGGKATFVDSHPGCLVGILEDCAPFQEVRLQLAPGDTLIFYSDGLTEATHLPTGELFGNQRLLSIAMQLPENSSLADYISIFRSEVDRFCAPSSAQDDLTLLLLRYRG
jgi:phosphoserine phosphatase RsbU/P